MNHPSGGGLPRFISGSSTIPVLQTVHVIPVFQPEKSHGKLPLQFVNWVGIDIIRPVKLFQRRVILAAPETR
ncbi:hypothetical protein L873DRAFT_1819376 [Choiromyces venosus 120613-1]|uniref:Uncharacterized protein n=1 Tax=Choiromyces venosus 120613-1 TaxID=1336337 RepID=A0A3N4J4B9_9PEZI|nr:hypothetical protein L873DRAFT_1819376 [Choiromyces venosus 120613-1]